MEERKVCGNCKKPLISFMGIYLHPEAPCSGITDNIDIEATIQDQFLNDKFVELYGKPTLSDYDRVTELEKENLKLDKETIELAKIISHQITILNNPIVDFSISFVDWVKRRFL